MSTTTPLLPPHFGKTTSGKGKREDVITKAVSWEYTSRLAFESLNVALKGVSRSFKSSHPFIIRTDASDVALGAVLKQQRKNKWVPVALYTQKHTKGHKNGRPGKIKHMPSSLHFEEWRDGRLLARQGQNVPSILRTLGLETCWYPFGNLGETRAMARNSLPIQF